MSTPDVPTPSAPADGPLEAVRGLLGHSTQLLLGATMGVEDEQWRAPSRLPGWSRGHVVTHLARNAEGFARLAGWARTGERQEMYPSREQRNIDIEDGSGRPGLELQVDLDTTAGALDEAFAAIAEADRWDAPVEVQGHPRPARLLPLMRLNEVALHHVDLDIGTDLADLDPEVLGWLLEFVALRVQGREDFPALELRTDGGHHSVLGRAGTARTVSGPDAAVLGWVTGRSGPEGLHGVDDLVLPAYA